MFDPSVNVMVVDDFKTMRKMVSNALGGLNLKNITEADDGATAWPLIEAAAKEGKPFALIVSDWNMPIMKGIELLKKVRENPATKDTPFLMVTAEAEQANIVEAIKLGVSNYVIKPFSPAGFAEKVTAVYQKHHGKKAA